MKISFNIPEKFILNGAPFRTELSPGMLIGSYKVVCLIGKGTFGDVYKVIKNDNLFALKLLKLWEIGYKEMKQEVGERFLCEYHAALTNSPYLIKTYEFGEIDNNPFFIMEYMSKGDLRARIQMLNEKEIIKIGIETLKGLRDLHNAGIVHRDIKPDNILFSDSGVALLTDFGISAFVNHQIKRKTKPGMFGKVKETFGTYAYIAPEQLNDMQKFSSTTPRTDLWSWGVMMYELFSKGEYPWGKIETDSDLADFIKKSREGKFANPAVFEKIPNVWSEVLLSCLKPDFNERVENTGAVILKIEGINKIQEKQFITNCDSVILEIINGVERGRKYEITPSKKINSIGRCESNLVAIEDFQTLYMSRYHCTIECVNSLKRWYIRDGQWDLSERQWNLSTNGTFLNSVQVSMDGEPIANGDFLIIGDSTLKILKK